MIETEAMEYLIKILPALFILIPVTLLIIWIILVKIFEGFILLLYWWDDRGFKNAGRSQNK